MPVVWIAATGVLGAVLFNAIVVRPMPAPPASQLTGCYTAADAPTLRFDGKLLHVGQPSIAPIAYRPVLGKNGTVDLATDPTLTLLPAFAGHGYQRGGEPEVIVFGRLGHMVDGRTFGVVRIVDAAYIDVLVPDGDAVRYLPSPRSRCST